MKSFFLALFALAALLCRPLRRPFLQTANSESTAGVHEMGIFSKLADVAFPSRHLLVMAGSDADHVTLAQANTPAIGLTDDQPYGDSHPLNVRIPGAVKGTQLVVANGALAQEVDIYQAANGQVQAEPAVAGTYYRIGRTKAATQESLDGLFLVEAVLTPPKKVVVLPAFASATTPAAVDLPSTEALANAIKADLLALAAALATPAEVKII